MGKRKMCRWYNETSGMKRAYDQGFLDKKWIEEYCWNGGEGCVRKKRFEQVNTFPLTMFCPTARWMRD